MLRMHRLVPKIEEGLVPLVVLDGQHGRVIADSANQGQENDEDRDGRGLELVDDRQ